jgi:SRSO17 transposase
VARQYCGQLGKQDNCQVAVSLSLAKHHASWTLDVDTTVRAIPKETDRES